MKHIETSLPGVLVLEPQVFEDERGFFIESWNRKEFSKLGIDCDFVQDNHSKSTKGVVRGLHYQLRQGQDKLVRVVAGEVYDVAVDIRQGSPHFGKWTGTYLSAENKRQMFIPKGFAHGFLVLSEEAEFLYKCSDYYDPSDGRIVRWNDASIGIDWPLDGIDKPLLSVKDKAGPLLFDISPELLPVYT